MYSHKHLEAQSLDGLRGSVQTELSRLSLSLSQPADYSALHTLYAAPGRIFEGMIVKADGVTWNPGHGSGIYAYLDSSWVPLSSTMTTSTQTAATVNVTATSGVYTVLCNCTSNAITVNLPTAVGNKSLINVKKTDASTNTVTVDGYSTETIDGGATAVIRVRYASIALVSDGTNWSIV